MQIDIDDVSPKVFLTIFVKIQEFKIDRSGWKLENADKIEVY